MVTAQLTETSTFLILFIVFMTYYDRWQSDNDCINY